MNTSNENLIIPKQPTIAVFGITGAGKSTLIRNAIGADLVSQDIIGEGEPKTMRPELYENESVRVWDYCGFEPGNDSRYRYLVASFLDELNDKEPLEKQVHCFWYCIDGSRGRVTDYDTNLIKSLENVLVIITKADITRGSQLEAMRQQLNEAKIYDIVTVSESDSKSIQHLLKKTRYLFSPLQGLAPLGPAYRKHEAKNEYREKLAPEESRVIKTEPTRQVVRESNTVSRTTPEPNKAIKYGVGGAAAGAATSAAVGSVGLAVGGTAIGLGLLSFTGIGLVAGLALYGLKKASESRK